MNITVFLVLQLPIHMLTFVICIEEWCSNSDIAYLLELINNFKVHRRETRRPEVVWQHTSAALFAISEIICTYHLKGIDYPLTQCHIQFSYQSIINITTLYVVPIADNTTFQLSLISFIIYFSGFWGRNSHIIMGEFNLSSILPPTVLDVMDLCVSPIRENALLDRAITNSSELCSLNLRAISSTNCLSNCAVSSHLHVKSLFSR